MTFDVARSNSLADGYGCDLPCPRYVTPRRRGRAMTVDKQPSR
jgi:hypothetical protein